MNKKAVFFIDENFGKFNREEIMGPASEVARLLCLFANTSRITTSQLKAIQKLSILLDFDIEVITRLDISK